MQQKVAEVPWDKIFPPYANETLSARGGKFQILPSPLPWVGTPEDSISLTLEWILRDNRADDIRLCEDPVVNCIRERWYRAEFEDGRFIHVCYPKEFIDFRRMYEGAWQQMALVANGSCATQITMYHEATTRARSFLWSAWNCTGGDGFRKNPDATPKTTGEDGPDFADLVADFSPPMEWPRVWTHKCSRCGTPLPQGLQLWVALQHSKLKGA